MTTTSKPAYWAFYWPLALTGLVSLVAQQFQNGALARYPNAAQELATFALAASVFHLFDAVLIFVPQMVNVLARSRASAAMCLRFTLSVCGIMTLPVVLLAIPSLGEPVLAAVFHIEGETLRSVLHYLALLAPNIVILGLRHHYTGLIVQDRRTATITVLNLTHLSVIVVMLVVGYQAGWRAITTIALAQLLASGVHLVALQFAARSCDPDRFDSDERLTYRAIFVFFWPVALTSVMFSLSRPILYSFLGRLPDPAPVIASMRVGFDVAMVFHNLLNQFRHLFVTFGKEDLPGVRRFMVRVTAVVVGGMVVVAFSPVVTLLLRDVIGVRDAVLVMSREVLMVMCVLPIVVTLRNYFHGLAMVERKTGPMGAGAVMRNVATWGVSAFLLSAGWLNHMSAAAILIGGFLAETVTVMGCSVLARHARDVCAHRIGGP